jgi:hypothetical protein
VRNGLAHRMGAAGVLALLLAGCAEHEGATKGALFGAAGGAVVGAVTSGPHVGRNAALGAVIGGLIGALTGEVIQQRTAAATPVGTPAPAPLPPSGQWAVVTTPPPPPPVGPPLAAGQPPDPTMGVITNGTQWEIQIFIDNPPGSPSPLVLAPGTQAPVVLDIGQHRIVAQAFVDTQLGRRLVGTFDRTLTVDARAPGWTIHFFPANF